MPTEPVPTFESDRYLWLKQRRRLDLLAMDQELEEIGVLVQDAAELSALANEIREAAKNDLEVVEAQESSILRAIKLDNGKFPSDYALPKMLPLSEKVQKAEQELSEARLNAALWATLVNALMTKSSAIRTAADLITAGYLQSSSIVNRRRKEIRDVSLPEKQVSG